MKYVGNDLVLKLPHIHAITGCGTISFTFSVEKEKVLGKCMKELQKVSLLDAFWEIVDYKLSQNILKFLHFICYAGLEIGNLVESRVRLYKKMKTNGTSYSCNTPSTLPLVKIRYKRNRCR